MEHDLVLRILDKLKVEPSEQLRDMLAQGAGDLWSPEAMEAARLLLEQRTKGIAPEPVYRTTPAVAAGDPSPTYRQWKTGDAVLAPGFAGLLSLGKAWLHAGRMGEIQDLSAYIYFYNGERGWVSLTDVKPLTIDVGTRLYCRWRGKTGTIVRWQDQEERFFIRFEDGQGEWSTLAKIEVPGEALPAFDPRGPFDPPDEAPEEDEPGERRAHEADGSVMESLRGFRRPILLLFLWPVIGGGLLLAAVLVVAAIGLLVQLLR